MIFLGAGKFITNIVKEAVTGLAPEFYFFSFILMPNNLRKLYTNYHQKPESQRLGFIQIACSSESFSNSTLTKS